MPLLAGRIIAIGVFAALIPAAIVATAQHKKALGPQAPESDQRRKDRHGDTLPPGAVSRVGTVRLRATADGMVLLADGKRLLTVSGGRTIGRWDAATGKLLGESHLPGVHADNSALSPDGKLAAVGEEHGISVWDIATGKRMHFLQDQYGRVAFSPDSKMLATSAYTSPKVDGPGKGTIHVWELASGKERVVFELRNHIHDLAFSPHGRRLYAVVDNHSLRAWDLQSGMELWHNDHAASTLAVAADGKTLWTDTYLRPGLHQWDADSGKHLATLDNGQELWTAYLVVSPDGKFLAQATWDETLLWDLERQKLLRRLAGAGPHLAFAADGQSLFSAGRLLLRWDTASGKLLYPDTRAEGHIGPVVSLAFAPDGSSLATSGDDGTVRLWALGERVKPGAASHRVLRTDGALHGARTLDVAGRSGRWGVPTVPVCFTPNGRHLLSDVAGDTLAFTDVATGKEGLRFQTPKDDRYLFVPAAARVSADGKSVLVQANGFERQIVGGDARLIESQPVYAWDAATGKQTLSRMVAASFLGGAAFSPDGRLVLAAHGKLFDLRTGRARTLVDAPIDIGPPLTFSPDGRLLAVTEPYLLSGPATAVRVYETVTGRQIVRITAALGHYRGLAFSPDGCLLAATGQDALHIWESATGKRLLYLEAKGRLTQWNGSTFAACLAVAPDGKMLATGHADGTALLWDLASAWAGLTPPAGPIDAEACWTDLAAADAAKAQAAIERLASAPAKALPLLKKHLAPHMIDPQWLASRLEDLGSTKFAVREAAMRDLEKVADVIESDLRRLMDKPSSLEVRDRLARILKFADANQIEILSPPELRRLRTVAVLERIASDDARAILRELATGTSDARLTRAAKAAVARLAERRQ
jgi:WD40 repeat protein